MKALKWLQENKITIISIIVLLAIFFIAISIIGNTYVKPIKTERDAIKKEKQELLKQIANLEDSIKIQAKFTKERILYDTVFVNKIIKEKTKINETLSVIPTLTVDSNLRLHTKLTEEYIQTGFAPDSSK